MGWGRECFLPAISLQDHLFSPRPPHAQMHMHARQYLNLGEMFYNGTTLSIFTLASGAWS